MRSSPNFRLLYAIGLILCLYLIGTLFYHIIEGWSYLEAAYFLTATFTTIGYGDIVPRTDAGRIFTIIIAWVGISLGFYLIYSIMDYRKHSLDSHIKRRFVALHNAFKQAKREMTEEDIDTVFSSEHVVVAGGSHKPKRRKDIQE